MYVTCHQTTTLLSIHVDTYQVSTVPVGPITYMETPELLALEHVREKLIGQQLNMPPFQFAASVRVLERLHQWRPQQRPGAEAGHG